MELECNRWNEKGSKTITISNSIGVVAGDYIDIKVYSDYWNYDNDGGEDWNPVDYVGQIYRFLAKPISGAKDYLHTRKLLLTK